MPHVLTVIASLKLGHFTCQWSPWPEPWGLLITSVSIGDLAWILNLKVQVVTQVPAK